MPPGPAPDGYLANDGQLLSWHVESVLEGTGAGTRVCQVQPAGGLHLRVLLDRGMDVGAAWFAGQPIAWLSPSGERPRGYADAGEGWHRGWAGGLLTTCGLRHIGPPASTGGRHGRFSDCPVEAFTVQPFEDGQGLEFRGRVRETDGLDRGLVLERSLRVFAGRGAIEVEDQVRNETSSTVPAPILYHLNFGYPFLGPESRTLPGNLTTGGGFTELMGPPAAVPDEVAAHAGAGASGTASLAVSGPGLGLQARVEWDLAELPRAYTWRRRAPGCYVHAVEPTNACLEQDDARPWPTLEPGAARTTGFTLLVEEREPNAANGASL
jgi:hypothetical protein